MTNPGLNWMIKKSSINDRLYWKVSNDLTAFSNPNNNYQIVVINTPHPESKILVNNSQILLLNLKILSVIQSWIIG